MQLTLQFFGPFQATLSGKPALESRAKKIEALLAFLAVESETAHRRDHLVGLLFPEMPEEQARINLRQTLARLRRAIGDAQAEPPFLLISREATQFNQASAHTLDVRQFLQGLAGCAEHEPERDPACPACIESLAAAAALYRGPFLEEFFLEDSAAFDEWLLATRTWLQEQALVTLQELATYYEQRGAYATAVRYLRRQLQIEPWREEAHRGLMRLLSYLGEREAALHQYQVLEAVLEQELGVAPLPETRGLRDRIMAVQSPRPYRLPPANPLFVGREEELALLHTYLVDPSQRVITLFGPGGSGKTALAVEAAWQAAAQFLGPFPDGVYFVPLAGVSLEPAGNAAGFDPLATAVAEAIGFAFSGATGPRRQLVRYLADKVLLLVLDNVEHLLPDGLHFVRDLVLETDAPRVLLTSRSRLGLSAEWVIDVTGLPYPSGQHTDPVLALQEYPALQLFAGQSRRLLPSFELTDGDGPCTVSDARRIVHLVQGLPLGIELAASWVRLLSCAEIAAQIEQNLDFLQDTGHAQSSRHESLRAVFNSSWQMLSTEERQALRRLSVFHGPFDQTAAAAVSGASLATLQNLIDRSWLRRTADAHSSDVAFEFLEVLRQFAAEKLASQPAEAQETAAAHAAHYMSLLAAQNEALEGGDQQRALQVISRAIPEVRAAWRWAARHGQVEQLALALQPLGQFYYMRSWFSEGADLFSYAAACLAPQPGTPYDSLWAQIAARQGWFLFLLGDQEKGHALLAQSVANLRPSGPSPALAYALNFGAATASLMGNYTTAEIQAQEALALTKAIDDPYGHIIAHNILSQIAFQRGDYEAARRYCEGSLVLERLIGNQWSSGFSLTNLGRVAFAQENYADARRYFGQSLAIRQSLTDERGQAISLRYLGNTAAMTGAFAEARTYFEDSLLLFRRIGSQDETAGTLNSMGWLALYQAETTAAEEAFFAALFEARAATAVPRILEAVAGLAQVAALGGAIDRAAQLAGIVATHPAASFSSRARATELLATLPASTQAGPLQQGDLEAVVDKLILEHNPT